MVKPLKLEYAKRMIKAAEDAGDEYGLRDAAMMRLLLNTGIRREELVRLHIGDIDFDTGDIFIRGKSDNERTVYASPRTLQAIEDWLKIRPRTDDEHLVISLHAHKAGIYGGIRPDSVNDMLVKWKEAAGIPKPVSVSPHKWRHLFGSLFGAHSRNPFALQELMGHANIETTKIYVQIEPDTLRRLSSEYSPDVD